MRICFATNNIHKLQEVQELLGEGIQLSTLAEIGCLEELPEERDTIEGNSLQKAEYVFKKYNFPCFADDSGLEVKSIDGAPGVHSAIYAGPQRDHNDNMNLLLKNMEGISDRQARFKTVVTLALEDQVYQFEGLIPGTILIEKRGNKGFGYDPLFLPDGSSQTFGEMTTSQKNVISHRAVAIGKLVAFLKTLRVQNPD